jgi:histone H3/H4
MSENTNYTIIGAVRNMLKDVDPSPFTRPALDKVHLRVEQFIEDLIVQSINSARRQQSEVVNPRDVDLAADIVFLRRKRKFYSAVGTIGGAFFGCGLAMAGELASHKDKASPEWWIVALLAVTAGAVGMTIQLFRE